MAPSSVEARPPHWTTRERPWLVSWNRRVRHLRSIAVRNLALVVPENKTRPRTADDAALPQALKSPAKLLALREAKGLGHSRSSDDLRPIHEAAGHGHDVRGELVNGSHKPFELDKVAAPSGGKLRRRSTHDWASANPQVRQKRMNDVSAARLGDVFFSLHAPGVDQPAYISEVVKATMNPTFQRVDVASPEITRLGSLTFKLFVRKGSSGRYVELINLSLDLRSLQFLGRDLANFNHPFPPNCVIFELTDGYYTCFTDAQVDELPDPFLGAQARTAAVKPLRSASFDALLRLSKLDDSIQDALASRARLEAQLSQMTEANREAVTRKNRLEEYTDYLKTIKYAQAGVEKQLRNSRRLLEQKQTDLAKRRRLLTQGRASLSTTPPPSDHATSASQTRESLTVIARAIASQRRRIAADLALIYPITPDPSTPLSFSIRALPLPASDALDARPAPSVPAALGHAAHLLQLLSFYLSRPLPYPVAPRSSSSSVRDPLSALPATAQRVFPLFAAAGPRYRFEYALLLLNKDVQVLLADAFAVRVLDIRQTLPNLLYVLACMGAGEGELPARKAGGVRGLMRGGHG